jgi:hypothetical protein
MNSLEMRLKNLTIDSSMHTTTFRPQLVAIESANFTIPSVTKGMSNTPGRMHQNGNKPVMVNMKILKVYQAE